MARSVSYIGPTTNVIVDCRDGSKDRVVPLAEAKRLYADGKLVWDSTNGCYSTPETGEVIPEIAKYPQRG